MEDFHLSESFLLPSQSDKVSLFTMEIEYFEMVKEKRKKETYSVAT